MKPAIAVLTSRPFLSFVGIAALGVLLWFVGPLAGLEDDVLRLALLGVLLLAWLGYLGWLVWSRKRSDKALADGLTAMTADDHAGAEQEAMAERFRKALDLLARSQDGKLKDGGVRDLPWYIFIGPPGSGKTTALTNCGLRFPLAKEMGLQSVKGVAGTRMCDWWFTDEAVLIDTAGRYTTQDSNAPVDRAGWTGFLDLLKTHRPEQPINGAIVAVSVADLLQGDQAGRLAHAAAVRQRLKELVERLGVRIPIYVLFTKTDLIAGFTEFFETLSQEDRKQVFGMTFPLETAGSEEGVVGQFPPEFDKLVTRLNDRLLDRVHEERDHERRGLVFAFPTQFASIRDAAAEFLNEVFLPTRFEAKPLLRGVYFTSGTQQGTPIDRLMGALTATFGLRRGGVRAFTGQSRSYFLERVLRNVAFEEAGLVGVDPKVAGQRTLIRRLAFAALALVTLGVTAALVVSYLDNQRLVAAEESAAEAYRAAAAGLPPKVTDGELRPVLPVLDRVRTLPAGWQTMKAGSPLAMDVGLYQGDKLGAGGEALYRRALAGILGPRLVVRLHTRLGDQLVQKPAPNAEETERLLSLYLALSGNGKVDPAAARDWLARDLAAAGYGEGEIRSADGHLETFLERGPRPLPIAQPLVERARAVVRELTPAERGYARLRRSPEAAALAPWRPSDQGGPEISRVFTRASGAKLSDGIPGLYTFQGFHTVVLPGLPAAAGAIRDASWLLGDTAASAPGALETEILTLYLRDYAQRWDGLLADLSLPDLSDLKQVAELVNTLAGRSSPLKLFLTNVAEETALARAPKVPGVPAAAPATGAAATLAAIATTSGPLLQAKQIVDDRFRLLNDFTTGTPPRVDDLAKTLEGVFTNLSRLVASRNAGAGLVDATQGGSEAFLRLGTETASLPYPVKGWMEQLARGHSRIAVGGARAQLNAEWTADVLPWCRRTLDNRYPFTRTAAVEVALDDFVRLFAPGGLLDTFFQNRLKPYVDVSVDPWRFQRVDGVDLGISPSVLVQFQKAARIRDAFFPDGGKEPRARFDVKATAISPALEQVVLTVDGQAMTFAKNSPQAFSVQWPGSAGARQVLVAFNAAVPPAPAPAPAVPGAAPVPAPAPVAAPPPVIVNRDGPWAFLRLVEGSGLRRTKDPNRFLFGVADGGFNATFELRAGSALNPLTLPDLKDFQCPAQL